MAVEWLREQVRERLSLSLSLTATGRGEWAIQINGDFDYSIYARVDITAHDAVVDVWREDVACLVAANDPRDTIARCEAELAILDAHDRPEHYCPLPVLPSAHGQLWTPAEGPCWTVRSLASGYRHRPGYAEHWGEVAPR